MVLALSSAFAPESASARELCLSVHSGYSPVFKPHEEMERILVSSGKSVRQREWLKAVNRHFPTTRGFEAYRSIFGSLFFDTVAQMKSTDVILDGGSGDSYMFDSLTGPFHPKYIGVTYNLVHRKIEDFAKQIQAGVAKIFTGRYFESIPQQELRELGPIKLITDYYGVLSYTDRPDLVLKKYLELLDGDGIIMIHGPNMGLEHGGSFHSWLKSVSGIDLIVTDTNIYNEFNEGYAFYIKKNGQPISIPGLLLKSYRTDLPPITKFELSGEIITLE
jgi:hypothetical protein